MQPKGQLLNIQILRAVAALLVVVGHAGQEMTAIAARTGVAAPSMSGFNWGWGVDIFFVISGFIMVHTSAGHFGAPGAAREFFVRRIIRIVPLYWLTTTALIVGAIFAPRLLNVPIGEWQHIAASYLFIPDARVSGEIRPVVALGWTLNYEMFFYVFFALSMLLPLRKGMFAIFGLFSLFVVFGLFGPTGHIALDFWTSSLLLEFLFGIGIGLIARSGRGMGLLPALLLACAGVGSAIALGPLWGWGEPLPEVLRSGIPAALLVAAGALGPDAPRLRLPLLGAFIGDASYALYLAHPFAIRPLRDVWVKFAGDQLPLPVYLLFSVSVAIALAALLHLLFEKPVTKWLNTMRAGGREAAPQRSLSQSPA